jgi:hypothetical protein
MEERSFPTEAISRYQQTASAHLPWRAVPGKTKTPRGDMIYFAL